ncbi:MAG TPA: DUF805 domain-containing protein [Stellaceae bacterium]|jgi:uncharacterized membrane protein YhaH (DUF805 family)|nr:DUF805 domain-containing protein [Stellaceae bacterium]
MKGNVIGFDADTNTGAISGHDGRRYDFATQDWRANGRPRHGDIVDFTAAGDRAAEIYLIEPEYVRPGFWAFLFSPSGRVSRKQYWLWFYVPITLITIVLAIMSLIPGWFFKLLPSLFNLFVLWPGIAIMVKRIHDRNKSGWLVWALYVPLILGVFFTIGAVIAGAAGATGAAATLGIIAAVFGVAALCVMVWFFVEFGCMRGTIGANKYGPDPVPHR